MSSYVHLKQNWVVSAFIFTSHPHCQHPDKDHYQWSSIPEEGNGLNCWVTMVGYLKDIVFLTVLSSESVKLVFFSLIMATSHCGILNPLCCSLDAQCNCVRDVAYKINWIHKSRVSLGFEGCVYELTLHPQIEIVGAHGEVCHA